MTKTTTKKPKPLTPKQEALSENTSPERLVELAQQDLSLARLVAKNINTPAELLATLGAGADKATRKAVATNPNTPTKLLLSLGSQFPEQLLDNPMFDLLLLENPNLLADMPKSSLKSLLKREKVPVSFLKWAANHGDEEILINVLTNPRTPKEILEKLTQHTDWEVA